MSLRIRVVSALSSLLLTLGVGALTAAPASAYAQILCTTYSGCNQLGMSDSGYGAASGTSYWRMYSGHNCTNYAAYRMVKSGMPNVRPWSSDGNASNWGIANASITNDVPAVGAVAWWNANVPPAGSAGHVAYVEQVVSPDEIIVSQDSWGGTFSWSDITRTSGRWPSGFVHFNDVPLLNTVKPAISGVAKVGSTLKASSGTWSPSNPTLSYRWRADGLRISGATGPTFTPTDAEQGKAITVRVVASKLGYPTTAVVSAPTAAVLPGQITNSAAPTVTGDPTVDETLTASAGGWSPDPADVSFQWRADGTPIDGATDATLTQGPDLLGKRITVSVTASRPGYTNVSATSASTAPVAAGTFTVSQAPVMTGSPSRRPDLMSVCVSSLAPTVTGVTTALPSTSR